MILMKNLKFCQHIVLWKIHREKVLGDVLVSKQAFLDNINMDFKRTQKWHFSKGINQSMILLKKLKFFPFFFVYQKQMDKKCLLTSQIKKKPLKTRRTTVYEKRKIKIFLKGLVHRFGQKFEICSTLIFMENRPRKSIWERSSYKKSFYNPL